MPCRLQRSFCAAGHALNLAGRSVRRAARLEAPLGAELTTMLAAQELYRLTEADVREVAGGFLGFEDSALAITHDMCGSPRPE